MTTERAPHVLVTNVVALNGGDAAIMESLVAGLRRRLGEDIRVTVLSSQADVSERMHAHLGVEFREPLARLVLRVGRSPKTRLGKNLERDVMRRLSSARFAAAFLAHGFGGRRLMPPEQRQIVDTYAAADFVVATGGTYLVENYAIAPRLLEFRVAMALRRPLALFTQSMGPFSAWSASRLRPVFDYCRLVLLRDHASLEHLRATGARDDDTAVVGDGAFTLGDEAQVRAARSARAPERPMRVAVSIRDWPFFQTKPNAQGMRDLIAAFRALSDHLTSEHGADVRFASTCQGVPEYWKDDARPAREVVQGLAAGPAAARVSVDDSFRTPRELMAYYRDFDVVVSMRMHAAILALAAGVPVLPIAYEPKTRNLFERLGFGDWVLDVETVDARALCDMFDRVVAELPRRRQALFDGVLAEMRSAGHGLDLLASRIDAARPQR